MTGGGIDVPVCFGGGVDVPVCFGGGVDVPVCFGGGVDVPVCFGGGVGVLRRGRCTLRPKSQSKNPMVLAPTAWR